MIDEYFLGAEADLLDYAGLPQLRNGRAELRDKWNAGSRDPDTFYRDEVGDSYLHDLAVWHSSGKVTSWGTGAYPVLRGEVLDFGGGIGTYSLMAVSKPEVDRVLYLDINETNRAFARYRAEKHGVAEKIVREAPDHPVDCLMSLDVLEHLPSRRRAILDFASRLKRGGTLVLTYTPNSTKGQHPMHLMTPFDAFTVKVLLNLLFRRESPTDRNPQLWRKR